MKTKSNQLAFFRLDILQPIKTFFINIKWTY